VHKVDGHELDCPEAPVDAPYKLVHRRAQILVLFDVLPRWHGELHEHDLADPLGVLREEEFKRMQLLRDALDVVEAVDAHDHFDAAEARLELPYPGLDRFPLQVLCERELSTSRKAKVSTNAPR
jgi:hypothetical protein